jgi:hypothetical protein
MKTKEVEEGHMQTKEVEDKDVSLQRRVATKTCRYKDVSLQRRVACTVSYP